MSKIPPQLLKLAQKAAAAAKEGHESQRTLMEKAAEVRVFEYNDLKFNFHKLELPDALRILSKLPAKMTVSSELPEPEQPPAEPAVEKEIELTLEEQAAYVDAIVEGLALASADGYTKEQFGRMTPPEFPEDLLGKAFHFVMKQNQMTQKQIENLEFFRRKQ